MTQPDPTTLLGPGTPLRLLNAGRCESCGVRRREIRRWKSAGAHWDSTGRALTLYPRDLCIRCIRTLTRNALEINQLGAKRVMLDGYRDLRERERRAQLAWIAQQQAAREEDERRTAIVIPIHTRQRKQISRRERYRILRRDGFKCLDCGRNPEEDGVKLHVDHQIPVALGGGNDDQNLWTLCMDCNQGKGASL